MRLCRFRPPADFPERVWSDFPEPAPALIDLEQMMAEHGLHGVEHLRGRVHLDFDTTVEPLFGSQEGALPGPNPRYHGRPSYHPMLAYLAETGTCVGGVLRPGDRGLGDADPPAIGAWVTRLRKRLKHYQCVLVVRADAGADCTVGAIHDAGSFFNIKARMTRDLCDAIATHATWTTVEHDADGRAMRQVAEIRFSRGEWGARGRWFRVVAVRERDKETGKQIHLWADLDYTVQAYITNDWQSTPDEIAREYDGRAEIEPQIGGLKHGWGIGKVPSADFHANHAMFLLKLLSHNLVQRFVRWTAPKLSKWSIEWLRRVLICIPGRLTHSGNQWELRLPPKSPLNALLE
jgi:hypothetical protein